MSSPPDIEVLVVGAGPVGCWVAAELCAAGVRGMVVEARENRAAWSRGFVVHPRTLEIFDSRGAAAPMLAASRRLPTWHFAMGSSRLDFSVLPTTFPFILLQPQAQTEELLEAHLNRLGGEVLRGRRVTGLRQEADRVLVRMEHDSSELEVSARFVVGCDGAHSVVRDSAGIGFSGTPDTMVSPAALVELTAPPPPEEYLQGNEQGLLFLIPLPDGRFVVSTVDHAVMNDVDAPWTAQTVRESMIRITGSDFGLGEVERVSTIGNSALQADRYREGRVLLAGDAAHVHFPMGGQGMNLGLQDAHNLAWRLITAVKAERDGAGRADAATAAELEALLDGYEAERRPAGERVLEDVHAQMGLVAATGADGAALRGRFEALLAEHPAVNLQYARRLSGIAVRYPSAEEGADGAEGEDVRVGSRVPDLLLERGSGAPVQLYELLREIEPGRFVRLTVGDGQATTRTEQPGAEETIAATAVLGPAWAARDGWDRAASVLIRPDGHVTDVVTW
jgi:2-polyprenyl-6-methoxyphenol hydroxylase-like FAD-dependent oxidoreductase